jgi:UDP-N-acetylmuramoyl-tripeptide--D-alanyl-D-alanine ligase
MVDATAAQVVGPSDDRQIERLAVDSRDVSPGSMFVALRGATNDGHEFIAAAIGAGAIAVLAERLVVETDVAQLIVPDTRAALGAFAYHRMVASRVKVVGVTGSVGKTTTKDMIAAVLARRYNVLKTEGNLNTYTGLPMTAALLAPEHEVFVAEYAMSAAGEIAELCRMAPPDIAVVLNVGHAHVGLLGSIEAVASAKQEMVEGLGPAGNAVLNADDARVAAMAGASRGEVEFFSVAGDKRAGARAEAVQLEGLQGSHFDLVLGGRRLPVRIHIPGTHSVANAVAAAAVGHLCDVAPEQIAAALGAIQPAHGRMEVRAGRRGSVVIDDAYNSSPAAVEAALDVLFEAAERKHIAVLGDMLELGGQSVDLHIGIGRAAASCDLLVAIGEYADDILRGAAEAGMQSDRMARARDAAQAVELVEPHLERAAVLVKASRGLALEHVVAGLVEEER